MKPSHIIYCLFLSLFKGNHFPWLHLSNLHLGNNVRFGKDVKMMCDSSLLNIGDFCQISDRCTFEAGLESPIQIGARCVLSHGVSIISAKQDWKCVSDPTQSIYRPGFGIKLGDMTFIGCNSTVLGGVKLGKHCVVGSNSVVTKSFPDQSVIAGCPAKAIIGTRKVG